MTPTQRKAMTLARDWIAEHPERRLCSAGTVVAILTRALAEQPAEQEPPEVKQIAEALRQVGLTLVRTGTGFRVADLGCVKAQTAPQPAKPAEQPVVPAVCIACGSHDGHHQNCARVRWGVDTTTEAPQPAKQPLTDEELGQIINANWGVGVWQMARAIEAAHGITGETK